MWGPRERGEWVGLTDPREQEMACLSGGCKGPPTPWGLGKATLPARKPAGESHTQERSVRQMGTLGMEKKRYTSMFPRVTLEGAG